MTGGRVTEITIKAIMTLQTPKIIVNFTFPLSFYCFDCSRLIIKTDDRWCIAHMLEDVFQSLCQTFKVLSLEQLGEFGV